MSDPRPFREDREEDMWYWPQLPSNKENVDPKRRVEVAASEEMEVIVCSTCGRTEYQCRCFDNSF